MTEDAARRLAAYVRIASAAWKAEQRQEKPWRRKEREINTAEESGREERNA